MASFGVYESAVAVEAPLFALDNTAETTVLDCALLAVESSVDETHAEGLADLAVVGLSGKEAVCAQFLLADPALDIFVGGTYVHGGVGLVADLAHAFFVALVATLTA